MAEEYKFEDSKGNQYFCLGYHTERKGIPIILIHGLLLNPYFWWVDHIDKISEHTDSPIYSISLLGHYPSVINVREKIDEHYLSSMVDYQIKKLVGNVPVVVMGHSTGALAAFCFALENPERVHSIISVSTYPHGREEGGMFLFFQWLHLRLGRLGSFIFKYIAKMNSFNIRFHKYLLSDTAFNKEKMFAYPRFDDYIASYFPSNQHLDSYSVGYYLHDLYEVDITNRLKEIECPCLLMFAENDPYIDWNSGKNIAAQLTSCQARLEIIKNTGHLYMFETVDLFYSALLPWLEQNVTSKK